MVTRIHFEDEDQATALAEQLDAAGHEVAVITERFAGEDDDEAIEHVVATTAGREEVAGLVTGDPFIETD